MQQDAEYDDLLHDAFATTHLWKSSSQFDDPAAHESLLFAPLELDVPAIQLNHPYAPKAPLEQELRLPDPATFEFGALPALDSSSHQSTASLELPSTEPEDAHGDLWQIALDLGPANLPVTFHTWEAFENPTQPKRQSPYFAEAGQQHFDAALAKDDKVTPAGRVLQSNTLLECLWNLGIGRSSILFRFNTKTSTFESAVVDGRASGLSLRAAQSIINQFIDTGNIFVYLRSFVERTFAAAASIPARVALATSISSILSAFEYYLGKHSENIKSLLQLQRLFEKPRGILSYIARTVDAIKHARTNEQLSTILHYRALEADEGDDGIRLLSCEILRRVAKPTLDIVGEWIGIQQEQQTTLVAERYSFVKIQDGSEQGPEEYVYHPEAMPGFISPEDGKIIFETGNSLRFLKFHHPEHPMASMNKHDVQAPSLEWKFAWKDIEDISWKAKSYEEQLRTAILRFSERRGPAMSISVPSSEPCKSSDEKAAKSDFQSYLDETTRVFDAPPNQVQHNLPDELMHITEKILDNTLTSDSASSARFSPPLSTTSTFSFRPLLTAQAKLVNATALRLFFRSHQLQLHFAIQRQYQLLGDGVFSSRLASALFDPDRESAERHKGRMRSGIHMGLQLGSRDSWPPASSELRLALMGVLSESYFSSALFYSTQNRGSMSEQKRRNDELPGQLNFAVRQLTEVEMERIMDPYALYAIDFLRLQYVPPSPLNLVISTSALEKYDYIFKFLLRLLRLLFVVARLPRQYTDTESRCFRMEAHHFITTLSAYIFQTGIAEHWDAFNAYISTLERRLADEDTNSELGTHVTESLGTLRDAHEKCLDSILFSLLLRRRQRKVMTLMEEIFELILLFAKKQNPELRVKESAKDLYVNLKGKIRVFLDVCRQLTGKKGYGKGRGTAEEDTLARLNVLMEMNGYFSKSTG